MDAAGLTATELSHAWRRGGARVLDGVSARVAPGSFVGVLGPNGAGKSTLVRALAGLLATDNGVVAVDGDSLSDLPARERARRVAYVPQREQGPAELSVRDYVALGRSPWARWSGRLSADDLRAVDEALATCGLEALASRPLGALSGGEQRRCITARALAQGARYLLLDEPLASLDVHQQVALCAILRARVDAGVGVLAVFHELNLAAQVCDAVVVLHEGRVVAAGAPRDALTAERVAAVFPCAFHVGETAGGAPFFVPLSDRSAPTGARTPR